LIVIQDAYRASDLPRGALVTIGSYDGVHRGQRAVLEQVVERARALGAPAAALTFEPHPAKLLRPAAAPKRLLTAEQKERLLDEAGLDYLLILRFEKLVAAMPAERFAQDFLAGKLAVREVHVGSRFRFGRDRDGDLEALRAFGERLGFKVRGTAEVDWQGAPISSTRIREALAAGNVEDAAEMLGRPFALAGAIARGDRMGKRLGWPTINLAAENEAMPFDGVYASLVHFPSFPATFECVTNIGTRPTLYENYSRVIESHVLDFRSDVYGERAEISFLKRLREERIFSSVMELSVQIGRDVEDTREYFARLRRLEGGGQSPAALSRATGP
jgi:riboflavin kinase/FMN adenylyltransferase